MITDPYQAEIDAARAARAAIVAEVDAEMKAGEHRRGDDLQAAGLDATGGTSTAGPATTPDPSDNRGPLDMNEAIRSGLAATRRRHERRMAVLTGTPLAPVVDGPAQPSFGVSTDQRALWSTPIRRPRTPSQMLRDMFDDRPRARPSRL